MNLPNCLKNIIGSNKTDWNVPSDFNLYVESLPGISRADIIAMADSDWATVGDFIQNKVNFSQGMVISELSQWLIQDFRQNSIIDHMQVGVIPNGTALTYNAVSATNRGVVVKRNRSDEFGLLVIPQVWLITNTSGASTLTISDNLGNTSTYAVTLVAGQKIQVTTDFRTDGSLVYITLNNTSISTAVLKTGACCGISYKKSRVGLWTASGWDGTNEIDNTYGIQADINYQCDQSQIACLFRNSVSFQQACLYKLGIDLLDEIMNTERANPKTIHKDPEKTLLLRSQFDTEYTRRLEMLRIEARTMLSRPRTECISCNGTRYSETMRQTQGNYSRR